MKLVPAVPRRRFMQHRIAAAAAMLLTLPGILFIAALAAPVSASAASLAGCPVNGWSGQSPDQCSASGSTTVSPMVRGSGDGCSGYYTGTGHPWMTCENTSTTVNNSRVVIRHGYYNPEASPEGFGWQKALHKHNLFIQPVIDTIAGAQHPRGSNASRDYEVYHFNFDGKLDQEVIVVADIADTSFAGNPTQDGHTVGVLTGYCLNASAVEEELCPDWVNSTL
jgi:hypothetical protein